MAIESGAVPIGTLFEGKYRIEGVLGAGGMGRVYEATHTLLDKRVALKVLLPEFASEPLMVGRMTREARAASATGHPNIAMVTDMGWTGDRPFIVMELLQGETLAKRIKRETVPLGQARAWMFEILDALEAVHESGVIHRDLKPENIMLVPGRGGRLTIKILDFGISKLAHDDGSLSAQAHTKTGRVLGTPFYMAPEQARALGDLDARVDLHSAGSVLYAMLCGEPPFRDKTVTATLMRLMEGRFTPICQRVAGLPRSLDAFMSKALATDRALRFASAAQMRGALEELGAGTLHDASLQDLEHRGPPRIEAEEQATRSFDALDAPQLSTLPASTVLSSYPTTPAAPAGATELALDVPQGWKPRHETPVTPVAPVRTGAGVNWLWIGMLLLVGAAAAGAWANWDRLTGVVGDSMGESTAGSNNTGEQILLLVDTVPQGAIVFVDDVQRDERPIELPRSNAYVKIRVQAKGYQPKVMQVQPNATRRLRIELER